MKNSAKNKLSINGGTPIGWLTRENLIKMEDLGVPPFIETTESSPNSPPVARPLPPVPGAAGCAAPDDFVAPAAVSGAQLPVDPRAL